MLIKKNPSTLDDLVFSVEVGFEEVSRLLVKAKPECSICRRVGRAVEVWPTYLVGPACLLVV